MENVVLNKSHWIEENGWQAPVELTKEGGKIIEIRHHGERVNKELYHYATANSAIWWYGNKPLPDPIVVRIKPPFRWQRFLGRLAGIATIIGVGIAILQYIGTTYPLSNNPFKHSDSYRFGESDFITIYIDPNTQVVITKRNLDRGSYTDGTPIAFAENSTQWDSCNKKGIGCWCNPFNSADSEKKYGKLYNSYAAMNPRGIAPKGWRIAEVSDFEKIYHKWRKPGLMLKSKEGWYNRTDSTSGNGIDSVGFNALAGGYRTPQFVFEGQGVHTGWWASTEHAPNFPDYQTYYYWHMQRENDEANWSDVQRQYGFYVRCVRL
jgi:uncharacterized protein (TIGR02145 family)